MSDNTVNPLRPPGERQSAEEQIDTFLSYVESKGLELYPAQEEAILELFEGHNVILNTPTGSGKSLVAAAMHYKSICSGRRSVYTCPIKALVNEKFLALCRDFGPENVGMMTGDASVNRDAPILCCTAEILSNIALHDGADSSIRDVIMDEFHYYSDRERGFAWQTPLLTMSGARFLLMSATMGETAHFASVLENLTSVPAIVVSSTQRPVPLDFEYSEDNLAETVQRLADQNKLPAYIVHFTQLKAAETAQNLTSINFCSREEKAQISGELQEVSFTSPYGKEIRKYLRHGIGLHHAGLLPRYRILVEQMAQKGLLKVICGTDTLGVGVNVPIRSVLLTQLCKYDGEKTRILTARDFHQICGRAGRKGFDDQGWVICQAPEHIIENLKMDRKAAKDPAKKKKMVKRKPPEKGFVNWSEETFRKLIEAGPEPLVSSFEVTHGMLLNVLSRSTDGCEAMRQIIRNSHETDHAKRLHRKRAWELFRSLVQRNIIEVLPEKLRDGAKVRVNLDLQEDFSLNQTLSLFLLDSIPLLDPEAEDYVPRTITLVESILENPQVILRKQLDKVRGEAIAEMKRQGVSYDDRMEELEKLEYPKPDRDFIYQTFNDFAANHPWVGTENIQPKSIAREMYEKFSSFNDYVKSYGLQKSEGILLRHISNVFKVLNQTVPDQWKTEELDDATIYFESMIRGVDSSLIDEWEKLHDQEAQAELARIREARSADESTRTGAAKERPDDITRHPERLEKEARILVFEIVRALAIRDIEFAMEKISDIDPEGATVWTAENLESRLDQYLESHQLIRTDPEARNIRNTHLEKFPEDDKWIISQTLVDPDGSNDWAVTFELSLSRTRTANWPRMKFISFESLI